MSSIDNITKIPDIKANSRKENGGVMSSEEEIRDGIQRYIRNVVNGSVNPPHAGNILHFFKLVQNAVWSRQATESIHEDKRLLVMANDPPSEKEVDTEAITFYLGNRESGSFGRASANKNNPIKEAVHHYRTEQQHPEHLNEKLITMGRFFDNIVVFNIYAKTDYQALKRLLWFENVMDSFRWYFGIHRIKAIELSSSRIGKIPVGELSLAKYSVSFLVRTEDTYQFGAQELRKVALSIDINKEV